MIQNQMEFKIFQRCKLFLLPIFLLIVISCSHRDRTPKEIKWLVVRSLEDFWQWENDYKNKTGKFGSLEDLDEAGMIDSAFAAGFKYEYNWEIEVFSDGKQYNCHAFPQKRLKMKSYLITEGKIIHGDNIGGDRASRESPIIDTEKFFKP